MLIGECSIPSGGLYISRQGDLRRGGMEVGKQLLMLVLIIPLGKHVPLLGTSV